MPKININKTLKKAVTAHQNNNFIKAEQLYKKILQIEPNHPDTNHNFGILCINNNKLQIAIPFFKKALQADPKNVQFQESLTNAEKLHQSTHIDSQIISLFNTQKYKEALSLANQAIQNNPNHAIGWKVIGTIKYIFKDYTNAVTCLQKALTLNPNDDDSHNNLGIVLNELGRLKESELSYRESIRLQPNNAETYNHLGTVLNKLGKLEDSLVSFKKAMQLKPDQDGIYYNFVKLLYKIQFSKEDHDIEQIIMKILDKSYIVRPKDISNAVTSLVKLNTHYKSALYNDGSKDEYSSSLHTILEIQKIPLFLKIMDLSIIPDLEVEMLLTICRSWALLNIDKIISNEDTSIINFLSSLALQCFTNEYIYKVTQEENIALQKLEQSIIDTLAKSLQPNLMKIVIFATYMPLYELSWIDKIVFSSELSEVELRQLKEPRKEQELKKTIQSTQQITNDVSLKVQEQYESNPYPRWVHTSIEAKQQTMPELVNRFKLNANSDSFVDSGTSQILVAGCGTGQHSIATASRFRDSNVLAIDLSLSSLSYAKRKTEELNITNIKYMQSDILDLHSLNKRFDIIESAGVLHHMNDPLAGWQVLTDCLRHEGMMRIGLYSESARHDVIKIRSEIKEFKLKEENIRDFRYILVDSNQKHHQHICASSNFYSYSEIRDLLFLVQEHQFTILKIKNALEKLGLKFCGFEDDKLVKSFQSKFLESKDLYDLDKWNEFEQKNPFMFGGMYQFWCQKI